MVLEEGEVSQITKTFLFSSSFVPGLCVKPSVSLSWITIR